MPPMVAQAPSRTPAPLVTAALCLACLGTFAHLRATAPAEASAYLLALLDHGAKDPALVLDLGEGYRLFSSHFVHTSWTHLGFNLAFLFPVGAALEQVVGRRRYLGLLAVCAMAANAASLLATRGVSAGASGIVFGLLGTAITLGLRYGPKMAPAVRVHFGLFPLPFAVLTLGLGLFDPRIDVASHVAGFVAGLLAGTIVAPRGWPMGIVPLPPELACAGRPATRAALVSCTSVVVLAAGVVLADGEHAAPRRLPLGATAHVPVPRHFDVGFGPLGTYRAEAAGGLVAVETDEAPGDADLPTWYTLHRMAPLARASGGRVQAVVPTPTGLRISYVRDGVETTRTVDVVDHGRVLGLVVCEAPARWRRTLRETRRRALGSVEGVWPKPPYASLRAAATLR
ncbi:MAG: rhomboid family intramembrane serine protease [Deltaproteobacteria bacterium]|nr:MAG: rhomboid family intramembrane serine protease [Deltaproteobacteria bacterium]